MVVIVVHRNSWLLLISMFNLALRLRSPRQVRPGFRYVTVSAKACETGLSERHYALGHLRARTACMSNMTLSGLADKLAESRSESRLYIFQISL